MLAFWLTGAFLVCSALAYLYYRLFPAPLPGIPYNVEAAQRPLGDIAQIKAHARVSRETTEGMFAVARRLGTPIAQLLLTSFSRKVVVVDDPREVEDILIRRHREFDRSMITSQFFIPLFPHSTISQSTTPALKAQKRLWGGILDTSFLDRVVAPSIHVAGRELVELWRLRAAQARGRPFDVSDDFGNAALDAIWLAVLGSRLGVMRREIERLREGPSETGKGTKEQPGEDASQALSSAAVVQQAVEYMNRIVDVGFTSVWPALSFFLVQLSPTYRRFKKIAFDEVRQLVAQACERYQLMDKLDAENDGGHLDTCLMDLVLRREILAARKNGQPMPDPTRQPAMLEELLFLLLAGHESTASALSWFVKLIALHPAVQTTLRTALQSALTTAGATTSPSPPSGFPSESAADVTDLPSPSTILTTPLPYLDATIHETLRFCPPAGAIARRAVVDTTILGCPIPAGTHVLLNTRVLGRGRRPASDVVSSASASVPEALRSQTSRETQARRESRDRDRDRPSGPGLDRFEPGRWLVWNHGEGREVFDAGALPSLVFGGGYRGCFGKKLALRELRIIITLLVLSFEFLPLPEELSGMAAEERLFRRPRMCHVTLRPL